MKTQKGCLKSLLKTPSYILCGDATDKRTGQIAYCKKCKAKIEKLKAKLQIKESEKKIKKLKAKLQIEESIKKLNLKMLKNV